MSFSVAQIRIINHVLSAYVAPVLLTLTIIGASVFIYLMLDDLRRNRSWHSR